MPDWRGADANEFGAFTERGETLVQSRLEQFMGRMGDASTRHCVTVLQEGQANQHSLRALDLALHGGAGLGLKDWALDEQERSVGWLRENETRRLVEVTELPDWLQAISPDRKCRHFVQKAGEESSRLEVVWTGRRTLMTHADYGPIGIPGRFWLFFSGLLRGYVWSDISHRRYDNWIDALSWSNLAWVKGEMILSVSALTGPWEMASHFGRLREVVESLDKNFDHNFDIYRVLYPMMVHDYYDGAEIPEFGSENHYELFWRIVMDAPVFRSKGEIAKAGRWFQASRRWRQTSRYGAMLLFAIVVMGMWLKWYGTLDASPAVLGSRWREVGSAQKT